MICCTLISLVKNVQWKVQCWKKALPKREIIYSGQLVGHLCLIPVYLTSLLYYFSRPLSLVSWFYWPWARVAFCSCVHTLRCALVKVSCFLMYYWVTLSKLMGQKTFKKSERTTYLLPRLTWDIQGHMPNVVPYHIWWLTSLTNVLSCIRRTAWFQKRYRHFCLVLLQCPSNKK